MKKIEGLDMVFVETVGVGYVVRSVDTVAGKETAGKIIAAFHQIEPLFDWLSRTIRATEYET